MDLSLFDQTSTKDSGFSEDSLESISEKLLDDEPTICFVEAFEATPTKTGNRKRLFCSPIVESPSLVVANSLKRLKLTPRNNRIDQDVQRGLIKDAVEKSSEEGNLVGDFSKEYALPLMEVTQSELKMISGETMKNLLDGKYKDLIQSFQVWFQNRRAKFRKQERLAQQKASNQSQSSADSPNPPPSIKAENTGGGTKSQLQKDVKPGSPHSSVSTTPNSNTSSLSSHHSTNGIDVKPTNNGKLTDDSISNNNKWSTMSPQSCNTALLLQQANKVLSPQPSHLQSHHHHAAAAAALSSPFTSLLGSGGAYLLGDHLKPTAANHLF